jgi:hypothetical protein
LAGVSAKQSSRLVGWHWCAPEGGAKPNGVFDELSVRRRRRSIGQRDCVLKANADVFARSGGDSLHDWAGCIAATRHDRRLREHNLRVSDG